MHLGLDFDNTLVSYDALFHRVACAEGLIPSTVPCEKTEVRRYLCDNGREDAWTRLQGEVYGRHIVDAPPFSGMLEALRELSVKGIPVSIVSHKTPTPYLGGSADLHEAARGWLDLHGFHDLSGLGWPKDCVFFELTKGAKVSRIVDLGCTHYIDDLPEILEMLPDDVTKILFSPSGAPGFSRSWRVMTEWRDLPRMLAG